MAKRVVAGGHYRFIPNLLDQIHVCANLKAGDMVRVVRLRGAPPPGTMGQCHVDGPNGFAGMVSCNSLYSKRELEQWMASASPAQIDYVKNLIGPIEAPKEK